MPDSGLHTVMPAALLACALTLTGCGGDSAGPGGGGGFDPVGQWSVTLTNAATFGRTCSIAGMTMTFAGTGGTLNGTLNTGASPMTCVLSSNGSTEQNPLPGTVPFDRVTVSGNTVQLVIDGQGAQGNGGWVFNGTASGNNSMAGTIAFRVQVAGTFSTITGPWSASRQ